MHFNQIQYFIKIVQTGSMSAAANQLFISQQSLSGSIQALENEFHTTFLKRSNKGVTLTADGQVFLEKALRVEQEINSLYHFFDRNKGTSEKELFSIRLSSYVSHSLIPNLIYKFILQYPQPIVMDIDNASNYDVLDLLEQGVCNIGFSSFIDKILGKKKSLAKKLRQSCVFYKIIEEPLFACVNLDSPLANHSSISLADLQSHPILTDDDKGMFDIMKLYHYTYQESIIKIADVTVCLDSIAKGIAYSLMPQSILLEHPEESKQICFLPLKENFQLGTYLLLRKEANYNQVEKAFLQYISSQYPSSEMPFFTD